MIPLNCFDGQCVQIIDSDGIVFEGICHYNEAEENEVLFGRNEESLKILNFNFYASTIKDISTIQYNETKYGHFTQCYGNIEIMTALDGIDSITDVFESGENEHIYRLLLCLDVYLDPSCDRKLEYTDKLDRALHWLIGSVNDDRITAKAGSLIEKWGNDNDNK